MKRLSLPLALLFTLSLSACEQEGPAEKAGEKIDEAVEESAEKIEETAEQTGDEVENAKKSLQEKTN